MRKNCQTWAIALMTAGTLAGCSTTARYVTAKHWSTDDVFYVGYAEYTETNYVVTSSGDSSTHVMKCQVGEANAVSCSPQVAVDRLLNPDEDYPTADPVPATPAEPPAAPTQAATAEPSATLDASVAVDQPAGAAPPATPASPAAATPAAAP